MPTKKQIITFALLCIISFALGYWSEGLVIVDFCFWLICTIFFAQNIMYILNTSRCALINRIGLHAIALIFIFIFIFLSCVLFTNTPKEKLNKIFLISVAYTPFLYALFQIARAVIFLNKKLEKKL